ncbi:hypothetical protein D1007_56424 [Hordeum vulgare]|nr:hypothetical protein D1007_56424 [Hordeum vulgare]
MSCSSVSLLYVVYDHHLELYASTSPGSTSSSSPTAAVASSDLPHRSSSAPSDASSAFPYPETDDDPVIDYFPVEDPYLSAEQQDDGAQEMEVPAADDCYPDGAYYYVEAADDQE